MKKECVTIAATGGQWNENGIPIVFELMLDENNLAQYYLAVHVENDGDEIEYFAEKNNAPHLLDELKKTKEFCEKFGIKPCATINGANWYVKRELDEYDVNFEEDDEGNVYGNIY